MDKTQEKSPDINVEDSFFFYPFYRRTNDLEKKRIKSLLEIFVSYPKNRFNVIKEIIEMHQLINNQIISVENLLSQDPIKTNYQKVFENFVLRMSNYESFSGERLFENKDELKQYVNYLIKTARPNTEEIKKVSRFIYNSKKNQN